MRKRRFGEDQIIAILQEQEAGARTEEVCRRHGISTTTIYKWKARYGGLEVSERRLKALENENRRLYTSRTVKEGSGRWPRPLPELPPLRCWIRMLEPSQERSSFLSRDLMVLLLIVVAWTVLGFDARLHWDEPQYLYAGAFISLEQIVADDFNPSGIEGFNVSRIAHVVLVKLLSWLVGAGGALVIATMLLYTALLTVCLWTVYLILRDLELPATGAGVATLVVAFSPVGLYLEFKTLPDVPALMWSSLAVLAGIRAVHGRSWIWILIGAVAIALAALTKHILIWTFVAFALAALTAGHFSLPRTRMVPIFMLIGVGSIFVFALVQFAAELPLSYFLAFLSVARNTTDPVAAKIFHVLLSLGLLSAVLSVAAFHPEKHLTSFFLVWVGTALVPFLIVVPRFEVRYLAPALIPMAGLTVLALDVLRDRLPAPLARPRSKVVLTVLLVCAVGMSSRSVQGLTEHEVDMYSLHRLLGRLDTAFEPRAYAVVTPWEYSTFLYLRLMYPNRPVYDGFDPRYIGRPEWIKGQDAFFDGRVLRNLDQLRAIEEPLVYLGFPEAMPISNLRAWADLTPSPIREAVLDKLDSLGNLKHISLSWMWASPELSFTLLSQVGHYLAYQVTVRETDRVGSARHTHSCAGTAARGSGSLSRQSERRGPRHQRRRGWILDVGAPDAPPADTSVAPVIEVALGGAVVRVLDRDLQTRRGRPPSLCRPAPHHAKAGSNAKTRGSRPWSASSPWS